MQAVSAGGQRAPEGRVLGWDRAARVGCAGCGAAGGSTAVGGPTLAPRPPWRVPPAPGDRPCGGPRTARDERRGRWEGRGDDPSAGDVSGFIPSALRGSARSCVLRGRPGRLKEVEGDREGERGGEGEAGRPRRATASGAPLPRGGARPLCGRPPLSPRLVTRHLALSQPRRGVGVCAGQARGRRSRMWSASRALASCPGLATRLWVTVTR